MAGSREPSVSPRRGGSQSPHRSRSPRRSGSEENWWNDYHQELSDFIYTLEVKTDADVVENTVWKLVEGGIRHAWQMKEMTEAMVERIFGGPEDIASNTLCRFVMKLKEVKGTNELVAKAVARLAKEQRASRRQKQGRDESSSEDDGEDGAGFNLKDCLEKYGLEKMPLEHLMYVKKINAIAKQASPKCKKKKEKDVIMSASVEDYIPQFMARSKFQSHERWVANWWSRALTQLTSQAHSRKETITYQQLLIEFLNANKIAVEKGTEIAQKYDAWLWKETSQCAEGSQQQDLEKTFTVIDQNKLKEFLNTKPSNDNAGDKGQGGKGVRGQGGKEDKGKGGEGYKVGRKFTFQGTHSGNGNKSVVL